jgi:hypothetical protein
VGLRRVTDNPPQIRAFRIFMGGRRQRDLAAPFLAERRIGQVQERKKQHPGTRYPGRSPSRTRGVRLGARTTFMPPTTPEVMSVTAPQGTGVPPGGTVECAGQVGTWCWMQFGNVLPSPTMKDPPQGFADWPASVENLCRRFRSRLASGLRWPGRRYRPVGKLHG